MKKSIWLATAASVAVMAVVPAHAQDSNTDADQGEVLVVTAVRGQPRTVIESSAPIDVIGGEQLQQMGGALPMRDALANLIPSFQAPAMGSSSWDSIARPAGLRGLGGAHVLVLVDGKRRHNSSLINLGTGNISNGSNPVDLDLIPNGSVGRIEVLRDGASAQYGSDAIAGVINIRLKDDAQSGELIVNAGQRYRWDGESQGETYSFDVSKGFSLGDSGFLRLTVAGKDQNPTVRGSLSTASFYFPINGQPDPRENTVDKAHVYQGGLPRNSSIFMAANAGVETGGVTVYANGTLGYRKARVGQAFRTPRSAQNVLAVYPDGFTPFYTLDETDWQVLGGVKGAIGAWSWDLSTTVGKNIANHGSDNTLNASLGPTSPKKFDTFSSSFTLWASNLDLSREFDIGLSKPATIAVGLEYRRENYTTVPRDPLAYTNGGYVYPAGYGGMVGTYAQVGAQGAVTLRPEDAADITRGNIAAYVDFAADLSKRWFVNIAGRFEHYDDSAGDVLSGKISTRYEIADGFALRGTISNGFRAPSLPQQGFAQSSTQISIINGVAQPIDSKTVGVDSAVGRALGARPLKPEKSTNFSVGIAATPIDNLSITVDAYRIELRDRIMLTSYLSGAGVNAILAENGFDPRFVRYFTNAIDTNTQGIEVVTTYRLPLGPAGTLRLSAAYNYNKNKIVGLAANPAELQGLNLSLFDRQQQGAVSKNAPRNKLSMAADWSLGKLKTNFRGTRYGRFNNIQNTAATDQHYGAEWVFDVDVSYDLTESTTISIGANNLFDQYPDLTTIASTAGLSPYATNSPFGFYGGYYYGRIGIKF